MKYNETENGDISTLHAQAKTIQNVPGDPCEVVQAKHRKRRWSETEKQMLFKDFGDDISKKTMPCGRRISKLAYAMSNTRTVAQIRTQIHNYISGKLSM